MTAESPDERPKGSLELAIDLVDEAIWLASVAIERADADEKEMSGKLLSLRERRAALQPRLDKRRENQAKPRKLAGPDADEIKRRDFETDARARKFGSDT